MEQEMKYVYTVYKYSSFSKAANALFITQPALSIAIQKTESRIGMPLFDRTCKPLKLTEAGELYIQKIKEVQHLEYELEQQIKDLLALRTGTLRIGGTHYFNSYVLPPVMTEFKRRYPGVHLELIEAASNELLQMLYEHEIDITFNCTVHPKDSFKRTPCFIDTILLCVPKEFSVNEKLRDEALTAEDILLKKHLQPGVPCASIVDFAQTPFILLTPGNDLYRRSCVFLKDAGIAPEICLQVSQLVTAWHLSCAGMGASFISDLLVTSATEKVLFYKINSSEATRVFDLTISDRHYISKVMKIFTQIFRDHYGLAS